MIYKSNSRYRVLGKPLKGTRNVPSDFQLRDIFVTRSVEELLQQPLSKLKLSTRAIYTNKI